ncbi:MAG: hypothetical protein JF590_03965 [Gemmatimonadetes bacterium]|nr:hypothetical protein [Gemmatimonadota bacterium]
MPSLTHLHLLINHLPVIGSAIAIVVLAWALVARSRDLTRAGLILTLVCGLGGIAAKLSGDEAEEQVESLPWADRDLIHEHEEAADWAWILLAVAGAAAAVTLVRMRGDKAARMETGVVLGLVTLAFLATARTALEGGKIRHEEVRPGFVFPAGGNDND